jgi:hypothetical protein
MLVFPQLVTGASSLYPLKKVHMARTVINVLGDGARVAYQDADAPTVEWNLDLKGLSRVEADRIDVLFAAVSGQWGLFTFLDPAGNLLAYSEEFGNTVWTNGPLIQLVAGITDPNGGTAATRVTNSGQAGQLVAQVLEVPGDFQYSISVWARTQGGSKASLSASTAGASASLQIAPSGTWRRFSMPISLNQQTANVTFGVQLDPGAQVDLFGMQVEAQIGPSDYKRTGEGGGVYSRARFLSDSLSIRAQGTDSYDAVVRIFAAEN